LEFKDGGLLLPQRPGLGFEFEERAVAKYALNGKGWTVIQ
jgi:L-alanine-DL-glutamate epimerase-like enolase superfamily enzyme